MKGRSLKVCIMALLEPWPRPPPRSLLPGGQGVNNLPPPSFLMPMVCEAITGPKRLGEVTVN